jgi:hypothetical protein
MTSADALTHSIEPHTLHPFFHRRSPPLNLHELQMSPSLTCPCSRTAVIEGQKLSGARGMALRCEEDRVGESELRRSRGERLGLVAWWTEKDMFG